MAENRAGTSSQPRGHLEQELERMEREKYGQSLNTYHMVRKTLQAGMFVF